MAKIRRIDFYPADWLEGTLGMPGDEIGAYIQICALIYARGGPIPDDEKWLARACGFHWRAFRRIAKSLQERGKIVAENGQVSVKRCAEELQKARTRASDSANINELGLAPARSAARETPSCNHTPYKDSPKSPPSGDFDKIDNGMQEIQPNRRARGSNPRARGTNPRAQPVFNHNGVTEHRPAAGPLRDPVDIAISLGLRDANGKLLR